ncbi:uncharacterized protein LOC124370354 [Homalodisca vitripennis]|uniref:uncharacterized protein LOC124370354 n=1 Tax=Homalodisca vitripennis TaxID=197043 RepID=UPI001EEC78FF|nr:uncharacterized protein LOC124370354 [Homalodisca vitripennis]
MSSGPKQSQWKLLAMIVESLVLYAAPVWSKAYSLVKVKRKLNQMQRNMALRVRSGYCTGEVAFIIADVPPLDLLVQERSDPHAGMEKGQARETMLDRWQDRWTNAQKGP